MGAGISQPEPEEEASHSQWQPQPQPHARSTRAAWRLYAQEEAELSINSTKPVAKPGGSGSTQNQSAVKPLKELELDLEPKPEPEPAQELNFPHKYQDILKGADSAVDKSSRDKLFDQLYAGVFLDRQTKRYWLAKKSNANCFLLYARSLSITWGGDQRYWKWVPKEEASGTVIEVAELKQVCWLEVHGKFDTRKLSPGILYEVSFVVMLKDPAEGWEVPVNVRLVLPGGRKQEHKENLVEKLRVRWIEIPVGQFVASAQDAGQMEFSMYEYEGGLWKQGLVIKGVAIKPKNQE